jgi:hypothetical protein
MEKIFENGNVLGIEVTIPHFAERCALGNLDHHGDKTGAPTAIEQAVTHPLPPDNAVLITIRADLDAIGAMAVLSIRATNAEIPEDAHRRIKTVADADIGALLAATKWQPKELPSKENPWPATIAVDGNRRLSAIAAAVADFKVPLPDRVEIMKKWLLTGEEPAGYRERVEAERQDMIAALENGQIRYAEVGGIATVISSHRAATSVGYAIAPVVVAQNPKMSQGGGDPYNKFTICQFAAGYANIPAALAELSQLESGWGGNANIGGSPQGVSSKLTLDDVVAVVKRHLIN